MQTANFNQLIALSKKSFSDDKHHFIVEVKADHAVFNGHFPERAILPGVVMIEIFRRAVEEIVGTAVRMSDAKNVKFLKMIEPNQVSSLELSLSVKSENECFIARGELRDDEVVYFKEMSTFIER